MESSHAPLIQSPPLRTPYLTMLYLTKLNIITLLWYINIFTFPLTADFVQISLIFPLMFFSVLQPNPSSSLHLMVLSPWSPWFPFVSHNRDNFEEYWSGILYHVRDFGLSEVSLVIRWGLRIWRKNTTEVRCLPHHIVSGRD